MFKKFDFGEMVFPKIHEEGFTTIIIVGIIAFILLFFSKIFFLITLILALLCIYFFRDPIRTVPHGDNLILSPADGLILDIKDNCHSPMDLKEEGNDRYARISIFLNIFNVHVNRIPISGVIKNMIYNRGKFINASFDKASDDNERQIIEIGRNDSESFFVVQIAGFIARRIICTVKNEDNVESGKRFGIIKFGSRVDLFIPMQHRNKICVASGQTVIGGETIICDLQNDTSKIVEFSKI